MKRFSRIMASLLALAAFASLAAGCSGSSKQLNVGYTIEGENTDAYFFMDREYALDASNAETTDAELKKAGAWLNDYILDSAKTNKSAFDFTLAGEKFSDVLASWTLNTEKTADDDTQTDYTLTYTKDGQPLVVTVYATAYKQYAIIEWTVYIENKGNADSDTISEFYGLSQTFASDSTDSPVRITTYQGGHEDYESFMAESKELAKGEKQRTAGTGGKPSVTWAPYTNIQWNNSKAEWGKEGVFVSTGWPGQWECVVTNTDDGILVNAKQEVFESYLKPGEKVRSPLMTLLFWEKDIMRSQNLWRRWVYNIAMPQPNGEPIKTQLVGNTAQDTNLTIGATTENQVKAIKRWNELELAIDGWQMDAGWYKMVNDSGDWTDTGNWYADSARFPEGNLSEIGKELAASDLEFILWYEPERIVTNSEFYDLRDKGYVIVDRGWHCYNLANDEATDYLIDYILKSMKENGVTIYRQDCNINTPSLSSYWNLIEQEGQNGLVENQYIVNYLRYFDAILAAYPDSYIDGCASGGKRLDLETTKRSVALWRDDKCYEALLTQCQSWGINFFMPYSGQGTIDQTSGTMLYSFRSNMMQSTLTPWKLNLINENNIDFYHKIMDQYHTYAPYLTADYYPLTAFSKVDTDWMAWQYNDYKTSSGIIQVFKRPESTQSQQQYWLNGLDADATYVITDIDTGDSIEMMGKDLMVSGVMITLSGQFEAKIYHYEVKK